jgi:YaiO family outer membrane protein
MQPLRRRAAPLLAVLGLAVCPAATSARDWQMLGDVSVSRGGDTWHSARLGLYRSTAPADAERGLGIAGFEVTVLQRPGVSDIGLGMQLDATSGGLTWFARADLAPDAAVLPRGGIAVGVSRTLWADDNGRAAVAGLGLGHRAWSDDGLTSMRATIEYYASGWWAQGGASLGSISGTPVSGYQASVHLPLGRGMDGWLAASTGDEVEAGSRFQVDSAAAGMGFAIADGLRLGIGIEAERRQPSGGSSDRTGLRLQLTRPQ